MVKIINKNLSMLCDYYEFIMSNGYFKNNNINQIGYFDLFFRKIPDGGGFAIAAGLQQAIEFIEDFKFSDEDIEFLRNNGSFDDGFLDYLKSFKFECDLYSVPEGTPIFPNEPILTVKGPVIQAQLLETMLLLTINHQSLIATKANRVVRSAQGRPVIEFGARRAQGPDAAVLGARAAYIGGCSATSNILSGQLYDIPLSGTMAHSWVQLFDDELTAFCEFAKLYPDKCVLLVDTYDTLKLGVPNAIKAFNEIVIPSGNRPLAIRIDSGDITYLSVKARQLLDAAGFCDCKILASNSLDENLIKATLDQGARVDMFGVGERLITSKSDSVFGGVYKLTAIEKDGAIIPKIKISENVAKITTPHFKKVFRLYGRETNKALADLVCVHDEKINDKIPIEIFDSDYIWKRKTFESFYAKELLVKIYDKGKLIYDIPTVNESREYCLSEISKLWDELLRFDNPHKYYVDLSKKLWEIKQKELMR